MVICGYFLRIIKVIDGYMDQENPRYIELYVEFPDGSRAVIKPYQT